MKVRVQKMRAAARLPAYAHPGDACFDLHAVLDFDQTRVRIDLSHPAVFSTGLAFEVPDGHAMMIFSRSGHGFRSNVRLANCVGIIDAGYRGEVQIKLSSDDPNGTPFTVADGDRIAQAMIIPVEAVEFDVVDDLSESARGTGGFGSSGK